MKEKKKEFTCRVVSIRDTSSGVIYDGDKLKEPEFKKMCEKRIVENIARALGC